MFVNHEDAIAACILPTDAGHNDALPPMTSDGVGRLGELLERTRTCPRMGSE